MKKIYILLIFIAFYAPSFAQDAEGCKDHPFFTRMPNFKITECQNNFNALDIQTGSGEKKEHVEANLTTIVYNFNSESGGKMPSGLQIVKNYENAVVAKGGKKIFSGEDAVDGGPVAGTFKMTNNGKEYWVVIRKMYEPQTSGEVGAYTLIVAEMEGMKQDIEAKEMFETLSAKGSVALYINFETGKSEIKSESQKIIEQIAAMLKDNPSLKVSIEGHTDNVGTPAANLALSDNRAKSVMTALVAKGIDKTRLASKGWGQTKPLTDNNNEEGKAKNRRVEIVKL